MSRIRAALGVPIAAAALSVACSREAELPPDLDRTLTRVATLCSRQHLGRSAFYAAFPAGRPSQWVSFLFSDMGVAEWPSLGEKLEGPVEMMPISSATPPAGPGVFPRRVRRGAGAQVVIVDDDARGVVVFDAYVDPSKPPARSIDCALPRIEPSELAVRLFQSNAQLGMSARSF